MNADAKARGIALVNSLKADDDSKENTLQCMKKPTRSRRRHLFPVCRHDRHHAQTCRGVPLGENSERADASFALLIEIGQVDSCVASLAKRERMASSSRL